MTTINRNFNANIYLKYLASAGYSILISNQVSRKDHHGATDGFRMLRTVFPQYKKSKQAEIKESLFKYKIKGTEIEQTLSLKQLDHYNQMDLLDWIDEFRDAQSQCDWSSSLITAIAKSLLSVELRLKYQTLTAVESLFAEMAKDCYSTGLSTQILNITPHILQEKFKLISEYDEAICYIIKRLGLCRNWSKGEIDNRIEDTFMTNLHPETQRKCIELKIMDRKEVINMITGIENSLLSEKVVTNSNKQPFSNEKYETEKNNQTKWCTHHRSSSHNNNECFTLKKRKHKEKSDKVKPSSINKQVNNYMIQLKEDQQMMIQLSGFCNKISTSQIIIDTGSHHNIINKRFIENYRNLVKSKSIEIRFGNGEKTNANLVNKVKIKIDNMPNHKFSIPCYVVKELECDIILGNQFCKEHNVIINYQQNTLTIDHQEIEMNLVQDLGQSIEEEIYDNTKCYMMKTNEYTKIVEKYKRDNQTLGLIPKEGQTIDLISSPSWKYKEYSVPLKLREKTLQHLISLTRWGIIKESQAPISSPAFPIRKPNGEIRLVIDYRELNRITIPKKLYFPNIQEQFMDLHGSTIFSVIYLKMGYHQINILSKDQWKTTFNCIGKKYQYTRLPFGLTNAPCIFQEIMSKILSNIKNIKQTFSTANNPTSNSRSERINSGINEIMRMYYNRLSLSEIERIIWRKLNLNINRTINISPYELFFLKNLINNTSLSPELITSANNNTKSQNIKTLQKINFKRNAEKFKQGDKVFKKVNRNLKLDPIWEGPFKYQT